MKEALLAINFRLLQQVEKRTKSGQSTISNTWVNILSEGLEFPRTSIPTIGFQLNANGTIPLLPFEWSKRRSQFPSKEMWQASWAYMYIIKVKHYSSDSFVALI
jgi:hypothetical protein